MRTIETKILFLLILTFIFSSCAGPSSPFGKIEPDFINSLSKQEDKNSPQNLDFKFELERELDKIEIHLSPDRQLLHDKSKFIVTIKDPLGIPAGHQLKIFYDLIDVSKSFKKNSKIEFLNDRKIMMFTLDNFRLIPDHENEIIIGYRRSSTSPIIYTEYKIPDCSLREKSSLGKIKQFEIDTHTSRNLEYIALEKDINPNFLAGLVAQESGFDPNAVSHSRAIGLTQITPIAEKHIIKNHPEWPKHEKINKLPIPLVKSLISFGKINAENEWRLDKTYSLIGGVEYLAYIEDYWQKDENIWLLNNFFRNNDDILVDIILASYNSGPYRVKKSIRTLGKNWVKSYQLKEARKYIKKVKSYCYHFAKHNTKKL